MPSSSAYSSATQSEDREVYEHLLSHESSGLQNDSQEISSEYILSNIEPPDTGVEELLHAIGSFTAIALPVTITMFVASFVSLNVTDAATAAALAKAYLVYGDDSANTKASDETKLGEAIANALAIVCFFLVATFIIVALYKYKCTGLLMGYMIFSSAMLLGFLGGNILVIAMAQSHTILDIITFVLCMYNLSFVGVVAIFYQKGTPTWLAQWYLILTSVIMAWQLSQFPEWSTWALVIVLAFYDLCAVLTPCGPLKWLVSLVQSEGRPLPGLLYEAEVRRTDRTHTTHGSNGNRHQNTSTNVANTHSRANTSSSSNRTTDGYPPESTPLRLDVQRLDNYSSPSTLPNSQYDSSRMRTALIEFYQIYNPAAIDRVDIILARYDGRERELWEKLHRKYVVVTPNDEDDTIKLGLGDFVFYSVLVSRAAKYDFSAMIGCFVSILMGLGATMFLLGVYKQALPALPISILLAVIAYFWIHGVFVSYMQFITLQDW